MIYKPDQNEMMFCEYRIHRKDKALVLDKELNVQKFFNFHDGDTLRVSVNKTDEGFMQTTFTKLCTNEWIYGIIVPIQH